MHFSLKNRPFLKWAGNKYRCIEHIIQHFPKGIRLIEPFTGSGAIFLNTQFDSYILGEHNPYLINLYQYLQKEGPAFIHYCQQWFKPHNNQKDKYYELRNIFNLSKDQRLRCALFLYLNRHGFNGLCRFNLKGAYNVPFGSYKKPYFPLKEMLHFSEKTCFATFINQDYQDTFELAKEGDVIYCDPPYQPLNQTANFTAYSSNTFKEKDQIQLANLAIKAYQKGCHVFISNHDTLFTRELYQQSYHIHSFEVARSISCQGNLRKPVKELLAYFKPN